jgi:hypothetical protein
VPLQKDEFINALASNNLYPDESDAPGSEAGVILTGTVKPSDDRSYIEFSPSAGCERWIKIPVDFVDEVEPLGKVQCREHEHDLVLIQLRAPETPEAQLLTQLLRHASDMIDDLMGEVAIEPLPIETEAIAPEVAIMAFGGFRPPRLRPPSIRPPRITIPPIVPGQIDRISQFSKCAKCKMYTEIALAALVAAAFAAAGAGTGPGAIAALKLALQRKFGEAAASAALGALISRNNSEAAKIICRVQGKC